MPKDLHNEADSGKSVCLDRGEFARRTAIALLLAALIVGIAAFVVTSIQTWFAIYLGILLAILVHTLSVWINRITRLPRKWSVVVVLILLLGLLILSGWLLAKPLSEEAAQLQEQLPSALNKLQQQIRSSSVGRFIPTELPSNGELASAGSNVASHVMTFFSGTVQSVVTLLVVLFLGIYLAFSPRTYLDGFVTLIPIQRRARARQVLGETGVKLRYWIFGQLISMIAVGGMITLGLYLCGIPVPLVLGFCAGVLDIIPIFGPVIAAVPAILLGFTVSPWHAMYAVIVFVAANQLEQHLLIPLIQRYSLSLPPALTVAALLVLGSLFGFWGLLLAAPLTATAMVLVQRLYVEDMLGDRSQAAKDN